jgi:hypothetical protein
MNQLRKQLEYENAKHEEELEYTIEKVQFD